MQRREADGDQSERKHRYTPESSRNISFFCLKRLFSLLATRLQCSHLKIKTCLPHIPSSLGRRRNDYTLLLPLLPHPLFSICVRVLSLSISSCPALPRAGCGSLGGEGVAPVRMPLHVPDASDGLHLWAAGSELVEMLELSLLQQVLAAAVAGELVTHPAEEERKDSVLKSGLNCEAA